jgi:tRNA(Ile)-lysidine synthase
VTVPRSASLEAAARDARYRAFAALPADFVALAHNLDDQAETLLLQLLRGAGLKGLSAMPVVRIEDRGSRIEGKSRSSATRELNPQSSIPNPAVLRPLLAIPRSEIEAYARSRKLEWIEDDSNADIGYDRNFLRHRVLPKIAERYPAYRKTLARASRNLAEAAQMLDQLAAADAQDDAGGLGTTALRRLSAARAKNALRHFLARHGVTMPSAARLDECLRQALHARNDAGVVVELDGSELRRFAGELYVVPKCMPAPRQFSRRWCGERCISLPALGGTLVMTKARGGSISLARLTAHPVTIRVRRGGERLQLDRARPRRSLKNLLQESRIPPWERARLPLLFCGDELVWVAGIGAACHFCAEPGEAALQPRWSPSQRLRHRPYAA